MDKHVKFKVTVIANDFKQYYFFGSYQDAIIYLNSRLLRTNQVPEKVVIQLCTEIFNSL